MPEIPRDWAAFSGCTWNHQLCCRLWLSYFISTSPPWPQCNSSNSVFPPGTYTRLYLRGEECKTALSVPLLLQQGFTNLQNCGERKILWLAVPAQAAPPPSAACEDRLHREAWACKGGHHVERGFLLVRGSQQCASEHKPSTGDMCFSLQVSPLPGLALKGCVLGLWRKAGAAPRQPFQLLQAVLQQGRHLPARGYEDKGRTRTRTATFNQTEPHRRHKQSSASPTNRARGQALALWESYVQMNSMSRKEICRFNAVDTTEKKLSEVKFTK